MLIISYSNSILPFYTLHRKFEKSISMGNQEAKKAPLGDELTDQQLDLLIASTRFDRFTILEWYKGFMV
jgi:hypothetical protein